ncbi:MAG: hypothetical protein ACE14T_03870 [Syntrophales bacterium]
MKRRKGYFLALACMFILPYISYLPSDCNAGSDLNAAGRSPVAVFSASLQLHLALPPSAHEEKENNEPQEQTETQETPPEEESPPQIEITPERQQLIGSKSGMT